MLARDAFESVNIESMLDKFPLSLKLLSIYFWSFTPTFILSISPQRDSFVSQLFIREAQVTEWQFELLFALIFLIWGAFLWQASKKPSLHAFFIKFTIWTSVVHLAWMILLAVTEQADRLHLLRDAAVLGALIGLVLWFKVTTRDASGA
jgi:hypothetical protein